MKRRGSSFDSADLAMLCVVFVWAANNLVVKGALAELEPLAYVAGRFAIVVLLLFGWMAVRRRFAAPALADWPRFLFAGLFGFAVYNALFTVGLERTTVSSVALLVSLGPIFTMLLAAALRMDRVRLGQWGGVALATAGVALFVLAKSRDGGPYDATGDLLSLLAAFLFAAYSLATRPLVARYGAAPATAWSALIGLACILPVAWPSVLRQDWADLSLRSWGSLVYASAISMLAGYTLWTWAIEQRGAARTAPYLFLIPIATGVLAALFFGERLG